MIYELPLLVHITAKGEMPQKSTIDFIAFLNFINSSFCAIVFLIIGKYDSSYGNCSIDASRRSSYIDLQF